MASYNHPGQPPVWDLILMCCHVYSKQTYWIVIRRNRDKKTKQKQGSPVCYCLQGSHQVIVQRDPFDGLMENIALGLLAGMAAGTAMRSFLWMPLFFCWQLSWRRLCLISRGRPASETLFHIPFDKVLFFVFAYSTFFLCEVKMWVKVAKSFMNFLFLLNG